MNKKQLTEAIAEETQLSRADSRKFLDTYTKIIQDALMRGESVRQTGFVTFSVKEKAERKRLNPQTRQEITVPACRVVKFSVGNLLKKAVNSNETP